MAIYIAIHVRRVPLLREDLQQNASVQQENSLGVLVDIVPATLIIQAVIGSIKDLGGMFK